MNWYIIKSDQPKCQSCGISLKEWSPFATYHEHIECASKRIAKSMIEDVKKDLKKS